MKKLTVLLLILALCLPGLSGCGDAVIGQLPAAPSAGSEAPAGDAPIGNTGETLIALNGVSAAVTGGGAAVDGSTIRINSPGEYRISGALEGQILVNTGEVKGNVTLTLDGAEIRCPDGPAILVEQVKNCYVVTEKDSFNRLVSGTEGVVPNLKQEGAALFSEDDLVFRGEGELEILGFLNNGVTCKDDLDVESGTITVTAVNNGIKGSESVEITGGTLAVTAGNDGVKSTSAKKEGKGFVTISGGTLKVVADGDGVAAESVLTVSGGELDILTRGDRETASCKGLKARTMLEVSGGRLTLNCTDHAIHSGADLLVGGGELRLNSSAGKGLSAHGAISVTGGALDVVSANDGLGSALSVVVSGGTLDLFSRQDGVKAGSSGGAAGSFTLSGGTVTISAYGDVFDAKGGAVYTGGSLVGVGTARTPQNFSSSGSPYSLLFSLAGGEGTEAEISYDEDNSLVGVIRGRCGYTYAVYAAPELIPGEYHLRCGTLSAAAAVG